MILINLWKNNFSFLFLIVLCVIRTGYSHAQEKRFITVAADGSADYSTISAAIQSLPTFNYQRTEIYIRNGVYNEKIKIDQDFITLKGESRDKTILQYSQLRSDWLANKDSIGPSVINLTGDDFILENITVENTQPEIGPHAFALYGTGTRTIILNCSIKSKGGDTVALWDYKTGMYYHANCYFEGAVDFVCPRGWCYIRDSNFYELKQTASIWHAGADNINQKFVIINSTFDGVKGFELGRHHYEAQFFLIGCSFSQNMSSKPIYRVTYNDSSRNRPFNWGPRYYFSNCKYSGDDLEWIKNNLNPSTEIPTPENISPLWAFDNKWNPENKLGPTILSYHFENNSLLIVFSEKLTVIGNPVLESENAERFCYSSGGGTDTIRFTAVKQYDSTNFSGLKLTQGEIIATSAGVYKRKVDINLNKK